MEPTATKDFIIYCSEMNEKVHIVICYRAVGRGLDRRMAYDGIGFCEKKDICPLKKCKVERAIQG